MRLILAGFFAALTTPMLAQRSSPDSISASFIQSPINFDGKLTEAAWQQAFVAENFTQRELDFGKPATEKTKVAILYDKLALYIGVWCYQQNPKTINAKFYQRDYDVDADDGFAVIISTFNDNRSGYLFVVNPLGARADYLVSGNEDANKDWNGVWDAKTTITEEGWFAEIKIPFNTLQFKNLSEHFWGINFERAIRYKNEDDLWQGWTRDCSIYCIVNAGVLTGVKDIGYARRFEFKPYVLGGFNKEAGKKTEWPGKIGADLNVNLSPTLKLNLTSNTDFAQVEADRIPVNLTRFSLYYPEKREFFLEGYQNYVYNLGNNNQVFYTRRIGLEELQPVSIIGGARLFGKIDKNQIGILDIITEQKDTVPITNNTVFRYRREIGKQSYIGGILTSKNNPLLSNQVGGLDASFTTSHFLKNKNLVITGLMAKSFDKGKTGDDAMSYRFFIDYPNDVIDHFIGFSSIQPNFNPELGFLQRTNFDNLNWHLNYEPRVFQQYGVRKMTFQPWSFSYYRTHSTGEFESFNNETRPFGFETKSGERFEWNIMTNYDRLDKPFALTDSVVIPTGKYWMNQMEFQLTTFTARPIWGEAGYQFGTFYTGHINSFKITGGFNVNKHLYFETYYKYNIVNLPQGKVITNEIVQYVIYGFNPKLDFTAFIQWNSLDEILSGNFRLHWIPKIGTDFYLVYNRDYENMRPIDFLRPTVSSGIGKLVWRFTF